MAEFAKLKEPADEAVGQLEDEIGKPPSQVVGYRLSFERRVLEGKINVARTFFSMGSLLLSTSLPLVLEFTDYVSEQIALVMRILTAIAIVGLATIFATSDNIVFLIYARYARQMLHRHILLSMQEVEITLGYVKQWDHNFTRRTAEEVAAHLKRGAELEEDDSTLDDEFAVLDALDSLSHKLRGKTFTLGDLQIFYSLKDVFAMEDSPFLEAVIRVRNETNAVNSSHIASFVRSSGFGWWGRAALIKELDNFGTFVMTGTGLGDNTETINSWVELFIRREANTLAGPNVVWASRFAAFFAYELAVNKAYNVLAFLRKLMAEWECFDFEVFTNSPERTFTTMDSEAVPIASEAIATVELTPQLKYRKGFFRPIGANEPVGNLHAFETPDFLLVYKTYATVEFITTYKLFNVQAKDRLIGLVKAKASPVMHTMMDFSGHPLMYEKLTEAEMPHNKRQWRNIQGEAAYNAAVLGMDRMILRPRFVKT